MAQARRPVPKQALEIPCRLESVAYVTERWLETMVFGETRLHIFQLA
jgi:hypothetical protein